MEEVVLISVPDCQGVIFPAIHVPRYLDLDGGAWTPTKEQVAEAERRLSAFLATAAPALPASVRTGAAQRIAASLDRYARQYFGVSWKGRRLLYVNSLPHNHPEWWARPVFIDDGGESFFHLVYDPESGEFSDFGINGEAQDHRMAVDWNASEEELCAASVAAIRRFGQEHAQLPVCFFKFDSEPRYGYVLISFDTLENNIRSAKKREQSALDRRRRRLTRPDSWKSAKDALRNPRFQAFDSNSASFAFPEFATVSFPEWRDIAEDGAYPTGLAHEDDYLESSVRLVLWRVAERLVADEAFKPLTLAAPFMVGYEFHDGEQIILRLLNWPAGAPEMRTSEDGQ